MTGTTMATAVLHLADDGDSGVSPWWWLLLLLLIPLAVGGWVLVSRNRAKDHVVHAPRPDATGDVPRIDLSGTTRPQPSGGGVAQVHVAPPASTPPPRKTATGDGVGSYENSDGERVPVPIGGHLPLNADAQRPPEGYPIKGDAETGLYHLPGDPWFPEVIAQVWFASEPAARSAGFKRAGSEPQ